MLWGSGMGLGTWDDRENNCDTYIHRYTHTHAYGHMDTRTCIHETYYIEALYEQHDNDV